MSLSLGSAAVSLIDSAGYGGLAAGLFANAAGIPIPSEALIPLGVVAAKQGRFNLAAVLLLAVAAQLAGGLLSYEIGRRGGVPLVQRYGRYILISPRELRHVHARFDRYGQIFALVGCCLPVIRGYIGYAAGVAEMSRARFVSSIFLGYLIWTLVLAAAGWKLAGNVGAIDAALKPVSYLVIGILALVVIWFVYRRLSSRDQSA